MNMELGLGNTLLAGDPRLVDHIVGEVKSQGIFDQFRKECIADVDTKPAYQNLRARVENSVNCFLGKQTWKADLNKNQLREILRKHIVEAPYLDTGVERIVDQVVNPKVYSVFMPQIEDVVYKFLGIERPKNRQRNGPCGFKDLLPKDLDPVSPESDKNSLKDVSLDSVDADVDEPSNARDKEASISSVEQNRKDDTDNNSNDRDNGRDGEPEVEDKLTEDTARSATAANLSNSAKSEDKPEEEEEDSPTFEPIDIMNLNESNVSNDSHLSGISELTSHRSRSPDFSNEASRDNMDFSNQDSQFSKVSSDSRLSIVTDFGSSNHASTPVSDVLRDDKLEAKFSKENFKALGESESARAIRDDKSSYESERSKENTPSELKVAKRTFAPKESSRDGTESSARDSQRSDSRSRKSDPKDSKRDRDRDSRKRGNHDARSSEKSSSKSTRDRAEDRSREKEKKDQERREKTEGKEVKDLKDLYKEKIRELREKKELTEKEKLSKGKDSKAAKDTKEKRDSSREKREHSREHKGSSSKSCARSESKTAKSSSSSEAKAPRSESRDKGKRDERRYPKDSKPKSSALPDEKPEAKRTPRPDDKSERSEAKQKSVARRDRRTSEKREAKSESDREKRRREEKKAKAKDDHSSLRKNPEDRRSTDRDGSNGSNGKSSQKSGSSSGASSAKAPASNLSKESTNTSNSSSETSDSIDEAQNDKLGLAFCDGSALETCGSGGGSRECESLARKLDLGQSEISLPIKKRPLGEGTAPATSELAIKKPKFAKNFQEAKRLMKIRRKMEKEKIRRQQEMEKVVDVPKVPRPERVVEKNDLEMVPDDERVQIIEVCDEEYDEPYPEVRSHFTPEERSQIILGAESIFSRDAPGSELGAKSTLSEMELSIRQSLLEMISDKRIEETETPTTSKQTTAEESEIRDNEAADRVDESCRREAESLTNAKEPLTSDSIESQPDGPGASELPVRRDDRCERSELIAPRETSEEPVGDEPNLGTSEARRGTEVPVTPRNAEATEVAGHLERPETPGNLDLAEAMEIVGIPEIRNNLETAETRINLETAETQTNLESAEIRKNVEMEETRKSLETEETRKNLESVEAPKSSKISETLRSSDEPANLKDTEAPESLENDEKTESEAAESEAPEATTELQTSDDSAAPEVPAPTEKEAETLNKFSGNARHSPVKLEGEDGATLVAEDLGCLSDDAPPCLYFTEDNERLHKFTKFMKAVEKEEECASSSAELAGDGAVASSDADELPPSVSKVMAPPKTKRKYSTSPLTDILLNNANNNNDAHKITAAVADDEVTANGLKKRKIGRPKKQRAGANLCGQQNLLNGENFVMPLSPESDVSASSEKTAANPLKDEKSRPRGSNQRYASDDLYKPRPLFASSSRRSRRSNPS